MESGGEPKIPIEQMKGQIGELKNTKPTMSEDELLGTRLNPVIETPTPFGNLKST